MKETLELFFFGILAASTFVATILMMFNFPRIRATQHMLLFTLNGLGETNRLGFEALTIELNRLEHRVKELENERT